MSGSTIKLTTNSKNITKWQSYELKFLRDFYTKKGIDYCANSLGRTTKSVLHKVYELKLAHPEERKATGFDSSKPGILYFVKFILDGLEYYKVGITNKSAKQRLGTDWNKFAFEELWTIEGPGKAIQKLEKQVLEQNSQYLVNTEALISGNTETFSVYIDKPNKE